MRTLIATFASSLLIMGTIASASAQDAQTGPGGVEASPGGIEASPGGTGHHPRHLYNSAGNCHVMITHRTNRMGDSVTVRRRVCD